MLKIILLLLILMNIDLSAKEWTLKHFIKSEDINTLQCVDSLNCYAFADDLKAFTSKIYKSTNQGDSWHTIYSDYYYDNLIVTINRCLAVDTTNIFLTYFKKYFIDRSTDGGKTFKRFSQGLNHPGNIFDIEIDPDNPNVIYASSGRWEWNSGDVNGRFYH